MNRLFPILPLFFVFPSLAANPLEDKDRPVATTQALSPAETAAKMELPEGFRARVFAGEPDIVQPIAYTIDDRGRLWVLENTNYPHSPGEPKDRILILEDTDGDGTADKRTVFYDRMTFASAIAVGHGGVWIGAPPHLLFFPRENDHQDVAAGEPEIVLDGWGAEDTHETLNNFIWGPDGWLYGTQGIFTHSRVGKPGTPDEERIPINAGIFRYHPVKKEFEIYAEGGSNQWGMDWDDHGRGFFAACVIPHMWQAVQGGRYTRQAGRHFNPHTYDDIRTIADFHYEKRAYCGAMIYLGGTWPEEYRNTFFFNDIHMNKLRNEKFVRSGSGTKSEKAGDFMTSADPWYRGLSPQYGPDGSVFVSDWYDKVPCHQQMHFTDRNNGRIYKIVHEGVKSAEVDLQKASDAELVRYQLHANDWYVRRARLVLAERSPNPEVHSALTKIFRQNPDETRKLRALWALHCTGGLGSEIVSEALASPMEYVRAWAIQLVCEDRSPSAEHLGRMVEMAGKDASPVVRMHLASAAGRIPLEDRWPLLGALAARGEDAEDPNIPRLLWYAAEPAVAEDPAKAVELLGVCEIPKLQEFIARRMASRRDSVLPFLMKALSATGSPETQANILRGMNIALEGRQGIEIPGGWEEIYGKLRTSPGEEVRRQALALGAALGGSGALGSLREILADGDAEIPARLAALGSLLAAKDGETLPVLLDFIKEAGPLRAPALRGLSGYDDAAIPAAVLRVFGGLDDGEKRDALNTLVSRSSGARAVLAAVDEGKLDRSEISAPLAAQLRGLSEPEIDSWLEKNWGTIRASSEDKRREIEQHRKFLGTEAILAADARKGRQHFLQRCAACHTLHGEGQKIGPELPGSYEDLDYLLENILDPNAVIGKDYQQTIVRTKDGRILSGIIAGDDESQLVLRTLAGDSTVPRADIESIEVLEHSLMPEGLLTGLDEDGIRDLFLYLRQSGPLPEEP